MIDSLSFSSCSCASALSSSGITGGTDVSSFSSSSTIFSSSVYVSLVSSLGVLSGIESGVLSGIESGVSSGVVSVSELG